MVCSKGVQSLADSRLARASVRSVNVQFQILWSYSKKPSATKFDLFVQRFNSFEETLGTFFVARFFWQSGFAGFVRSLGAKHLVSSSKSMRRLLISPSYDLSTGVN